MYNEDWKPVMQAESMEEQITEMARLARRRAENRDRAVGDIVQDMTHESYLLKHTTGDVLKELSRLEEAYPDAFYNGPANEQILDQYEDLQKSDVEFWHDYVYAALATGLEWAILNELEIASQSSR